MTENKKLTMESLDERLRDVSEAVQGLQEISNGIQDIKDQLNGVNTEDPITEEVVVPNVPKGIETRTIMSVVVSIVVILNLIFSIFAPHLQISIADDTMYTICSVLAIIVNFGYVMWKDHNFTKTARIRKEVADQVVTKEAE